MNALYRISAAFWIAVIGLAAEWQAMAQAHEEAAKREITVTGTVRDRETRKKMENVTVVVTGTTIGTVTNAEGFFALKIPRQGGTAQLELSHLGYNNTRFSASAPDNAEDIEAEIWMTPVASLLDEAVIYGGDARRIVEEALRKIPENYPPSETMMSAFYRETVQKGQQYIAVSEAMMDVFKTAYTRRIVDFDKIQLARARRLMSQKKADTLAVKVAGGPNLTLYMDVVKNPDALFDAQTLDYYSFSQEPSEMLDDRLQYVISFRPRVIVSYALFEGRVFIDRESLSFTRAEFSLDLSDREKATEAVLQRKPAGLVFRPLEISFLVTYRQHDGLTFLNYFRNDIRFKCDWKRRLFSSSFTARSEMVVVEHEENPENVISRSNAFKPRQIFYDVVDDYWNVDFWKDYNIIEPTESLENAVKKLRRQ